MEKSNKLELTAKEVDFLSGMTPLPYQVREYGPRDEVKKYNLSKDKYHCDPCDACGPDACASDDGCFLD